VAGLLQSLGKNDATGINKPEMWKECGGQHWINRLISGSGHSPELAVPGCKKNYF
jgi:hypothetical protein